MCCCKNAGLSSPCSSSSSTVEVQVSLPRRLPMMAIRYGSGMSPVIQPQDSPYVKLNREAAVPTTNTSQLVSLLILEVRCTSSGVLSGTTRSCCCRMAWAMFASSCHAMGQMDMTEICVETAMQRSGKDDSGQGHCDQEDQS